MKIENADYVLTRLMADLEKIAVSEFHSAEVKEFAGLITKQAAAWDRNESLIRKSQIANRK